MTATDVGPLSGIRVLDLTRLLPFGYATQLLADLGAEVIKIEPPGGEYGREMEHEFALTNRGKQSVVIDLAEQRDRDRLLNLIGGADAVFESFRPGVLSSLGLSYATMRECNPAIVLCSATGYGQDGPTRTRPGHDLNYLAIAGAVQPEAGWPCAWSPMVVADMASGMMSAYSLLAGVVGARSSGTGTHIDLSMADVSLSFNTMAVARTNQPVSTTTDDLRLSGLPWPGLVYAETPCYGVYETADGRHLALGNIEPRFWRAFLEIIDRTDLEPHRLAVGGEAEEVRATLAKILKQLTLQEWLDRLAESDVCFAPVNRTSEALRDPVFKARQVIWFDETGRTQLAFPAKFDGATYGVGRTAPAVGEHQEEIT